MRRKPFLIVRIMLMAGLGILMLAVPLSWIEARSFCAIYHLFGVRCVTCGVTRAFANALRFNFHRALSYNPLILVLLPIYLAFLADDIYTLFVMRKKTGRKSLSERLWLLVFPGSIKL